LRTNLCVFLHFSLFFSSVTTELTSCHIYFASPAFFLITVSVTSIFIFSTTLFLSLLFLSVPVLLVQAMQELVSLVRRQHALLIGRESM